MSIICRLLDVREWFIVVVVVGWSLDVDEGTVRTYAAVNYLTNSIQQVPCGGRGVTNQLNQCGARTHNPPSPLKLPLVQRTAPVLSGRLQLTLVCLKVNTPYHVSLWIFTTRIARFIGTPSPWCELYHVSQISIAQNSLLILTFGINEDASGPSALWPQ